MPEISKTHMGGTMRLGLRPTVFQPGSEWSKVKRLYGGSDTIWERHRHRYEVNPAFVERIEKGGLIFTGRDERGERMQVAEIRDHPYFVGMQAHPEFASRPLNPSPPFLGFVAAAVSQEALQEQMARQKNFRPPHPKARMLLESEAQRLQEQQGQTALPQEEKSAQTPPGVATPVRGRSPKAPGPNGVSTKAT